jgi:hypothetical protein
MAVAGASLGAVQAQRGPEEEPVFDPMNLADDSVSQS